MPRRPLLLTRALPAAAVLLLASGCGTPPWEEASPSPSASSSEADASTSPSATDEPSGEAETSDSSGTTAEPTPESTPTLAQIVNDLASGSTSRTLTAGATTLEVTYWSDLAMDSWTPAETKPVSLSVTATDDGAASFLERLHVTTTVRDAGGEVLTTLPELVDSSTVRPGYALEQPQSYSTSVVVPGLDAGAASVELLVTYEILTATTEEADSFAKHSVTDTLRVALTSP